MDLAHETARNLIKNQIRSSPPKLNFFIDILNPHPALLSA